MNKKEVVETNQNPLSDALIKIISNPDLDPLKLEKYLDLQERVMNKQSESQYIEAMSLFQRECPIIERAKNVSFGKTNYNYTTLEYMISIIKPILTKHGLSYSFDMKDASQAEMEMTIVVSHIGGHSERFSASFPKVHDDDRMNLNQRRKSSITYGKRTLLENAFGIVTANEDDDTQILGKQAISDESLKEIKKLIKKTATNEDELLKYFGLEDLESANVDESKRIISALKAKGNNEKKPKDS